MKKIFAFTVIILCLTLSIGFNGIAGALDKADTDEEMINVSEKLPLEEGVAVEKGEAMVDEADLQKEAEDMTEKEEMADESIKDMDEHK